MKKKLYISLLLLFAATSIFAGPNPTVNRLTAQEIAQCETPSAVAYNFVMAILDKDYNRMYSYMIKDGREYLKYDMEKYEVSSLDALFSLQGKLHIFGWLPALNNGYEVAVLYVQDEGEYDGKSYKKIYISCVPSAQIGIAGFQDIDRYDNHETNVKVVVVSENGRWKVTGFK